MPTVRRRSDFRNGSVRSTGTIATNSPGSKTLLLTPDFLKVQLGSQGFGAFGSFVLYALALISPTPRGLVPHNERRDAKLSRSTDRGDAQWLLWSCCALGGGPIDDRRSRRCFLCV